MNRGMAKSKTLLASVSWSILGIAVAVYAQGQKEEVPSVPSILVQAKQSGTNILEKKTRELFMRDLAIVVGKIGDLESVRDIIGQFHEKPEQNRVLLGIVQALAEAGNIREAFNTAATGQGQQFWDAAVHRIALAQAKAGDVEGSQKTVVRLSTQVARDQALEAIVGVLAT